MRIRFLREKIIGGAAGGEGGDEETPEQLRLKVRQLQDHVRELTRYYRELMEAFEELKGRQGDTVVSVCVSVGV